MVANQQSYVQKVSHFKQHLQKQIFKVNACNYTHDNNFSFPNCQLEFNFSIAHAIKFAIIYSDRDVQGNAQARMSSFAPAIFLS